MGISGRPHRTFPVVIQVVTKEPKRMSSSRVKRYTQRCSLIHIHKSLIETYELINLAKSWKQIQGNLFGHVADEL